MRLSNIAFPHPVLGVGNSVEGHIYVSHTIVQTDDSYDCTFSCHMEDEYIKKLIEDGKAQYFCEATCSATLYRHFEAYSLPDFVFSISRKDVRGTVDILVSVVAVENIPRYINMNRSSMYKGFDSFYIEKGDLLAVFGEFSIDADIQYEQLKAVSQIIVVTGNNTNRNVNIDIEGSRIVIDMHPDLFAIFCDESINKSTLYAPLFHSSIVLTAIIKALQNLESHDKYTWAKTIRHRLETEQKEHPVFKNWRDGERLFEIAQELLNNPYDSMLKAIKIIDDKFRNE